MISRSTAQLLQFLGQPVSCPTHRRCLCSDAGVALARCRYPFCSGLKWNVTRTTAEARCSGLGLGSTRRRPPADLLPVLAGFPSCGSGPRSSDRLNSFLQFKNSTEIHTWATVMGTAVYPSCKLGCLYLGTLRFFRSAARLARLQRFILQLAPLPAVLNDVHE